jgi:ABC-type glycerol-3-phosphate transport system permease component
MTTLAPTINLAQRRRAAAGHWAQRIIFFAVLAVGAVVSLAPFLWLMGVAFRPVKETYTTPMNLLPHSLTLDNLTTVIERFSRAASIFDLYRNSLIIAGVTVTLVVICTACSGFAFSRLNFPGRNIFFWMLTIGMFVPLSTALPALYQLLTQFDLIDTLPGLILPYTGWNLALGNFIMRAAFFAIPKDIEDAATIDGANTMQLFRYVMMPLAASSLVTVAIFTFVPVWGEYLLAFTFTSTMKAMPISIGIKLLNPGPSMGEWTFPVAAMAAIISFIPPVAIYFGLQRWFTKGLMEGALKF